MRCDEESTGAFDIINTGAAWFTALKPLLARPWGQRDGASKVAWAVAEDAKHGDHAAIDVAHDLGSRTPAIE
jgi:hypothetical protein